VIDPVTRAAVLLAESRARRDGRDLYENLDRYGLLVTEEKTVTLQLSALSLLRDRLEDLSVTQLGSLAEDQTPAGIRRAVLMFIDLQMKAMG
jgi:hypothetical protein